ncbi:MAG TPA: hypothetical protein PLH16_03965 [Candidatus Omnitrophota bacterium]|jgi:CxxC-x17-CxxC domain-containing protein|nr:hypothetical protein [Candidatus Omnitrophota bacterium]
MASRTKAKASKGTSKKAKARGPEMPDLVTAMMRLVERLEVLERKADQMSGRIANLPSEICHAIQGTPRPAQAFHPEPVFQTNPGLQERRLFQAVCSDCRKNCEVPFKPREGRPVYCPECWAIRKAGHTPKDPTSGVVVPAHLKQTGTVPVEVKKAALPVKEAPSPKKKKPAPKKAKKKK